MDDPAPACSDHVSVFGYRNPMVLVIRESVRQGRSGSLRV
jgi:hypothetical protein